MPKEPTNFEQPTTDTTFDLELLKREVGQRFPIYDVKSGPDVAVFFCRIDEMMLEEKFDSLRQSLSEKGYIPMLRYEHGEHVIYVIRKPKVKKKPVWINIVLLIATFFTTTLAGSLQWVGIYRADLAEILSPKYIRDGFIFFSIPLLLILGVHEMGHYYASKKHKIEASLPYFIPLPPPIFTLGTFGALISTKEPIPNRKSLLDIGVAGPICGFLVAIPVSILGLYFMQQNPIPILTSDEQVIIHFPLGLQLLSNLFTIPADAVIHPTAFAGWVGMFVTAINLLPVGQLDGGHVARAFLKEKHKYAGWVVLFLLLGLGMIYINWFLFAIIILFLIGTQHQPPLNETDHLDTKRKLLGLTVVIIFILCFAPIPFS
ncbi:MAG: site-2 protease family protein [Candidatus Thermoplasmatota archaeon]|jgi:membrane-associated protease RseP (regulator of RpoE activity)|nr:site-2 protease family protein [Candidatus Thermoplasmatota archaeon]